jgi:hypothetical protein
MTHNAKIGDANGAGVVQLRPNLVTEEWTQAWTHELQKVITPPVVRKIPNSANNYVII